MYKVVNKQIYSDRGLLISRYFYLTLTLFFVFLTCSVNAQWDTQSPVPTYLDIRGISAPTAQRVFIATDYNWSEARGALYESNNGGATWVSRDIPLDLSSGFYGLFFLDDFNGWAHGNDNYHTTDGGTNWTQLPYLGSTYYMEFYTQSFGLSFGNAGLNITRDSGYTWEPSPNEISAFDFIDNQTGLGIAPTGIYRSNDGGTTFNLTFVGNAIAVKFLSNTVALGIVDNTFVRSTDGGVTWNIGAFADGQSHLVRVSEDVVLAWGSSGTFPDYDSHIFRSADGGQTWTDLGEIIDPGPNEVSFTFAVPNPQTVVVFDGVGNMFHSADAGLTWTKTFTAPGGVNIGFQTRPVPVFADEQIGFLAYGIGFIIKTIDGGANWFQISSGSGQAIADIDRFQNGKMIAVGDGGTLMTSSDGIEPWILHPFISEYNFVAVDVVSANEVVVVNEIGQVYKSADGGEIWTASNSMPFGLSPAEDIHFTTLLIGWVIGQGGNPLYRTIDGGNTWTPIDGFGGAYIALDIQGTNIWAANITGNYQRSTDGGTTWIEGNLPDYPHQILDMDFYDENIGYAVGWWGEAFRSEDGGVTWTALPTPNEDDQLTGIYLVGPDEMWVSTNNNVAYYTANGGLGWAMLDIDSTSFGRYSAIVANEIGDAWVAGYQGYIKHFTGPPSSPLNQPPSASFEYTATGLSLEFTDSSTDLDGTIVEWLWDFNDGTFSTEQNPSHQYETANTYWVELTVTDDKGDQGSTLRVIVVQSLPGGTFGDFTEVTPVDSVFVTPEDEDFWVITTAPADYDGDGDLDIAVLGYYVIYFQSVEYRLMLLRNDGPAGLNQWGFTYINVPISDLSAGSSDLAWGDLDGDGDQDLAVGTNGQTVIYRNVAGVLTQIQTNLPGYWEDNDQADFDLRSIAWADFDNDGDMDLLIPSVFNDISFTYNTVMMLNDGPNGTGGWNFTPLNSVFAPTAHSQISVADYDDDQDLDLLLANVAPLTDESFIRRYLNDGNGAFTGENILGTLSVEHGEVQWGDYDGDGDLDILVAGDIKEIDSSYTLAALRIYRNDNETFVPLEVISCVYCEGWYDLTAATWADYDSDGDMDILVAGNYNSGSQIEGRARIYTNIGGTFAADTNNTLPAPLASGDRGGTFSWLDIDNDGDLDYFIAGQYFVPGGNGLVEAQMHVYRNDVEGENTAPSTPTELKATLQGDSAVLLSWIAAVDDHTPGVALTYDLDLFRNSAPLMDTYRNPEPGNVSSVNEWLLTDLEDGDYVWNLRAVDAAYIGSQIASSEFSVGTQTSVELSENFLQGYSLAQNFPNPFNSITNITFYLPETEKVVIKVYDILGHEIKTLINEEYLSGFHDTEFNSERLSSGVYFYSLKAGGYYKIKKMQIIR